MMIPAILIINAVLYNDPQMIFVSLKVLNIAAKAVTNKVPKNTHLSLIKKVNNKVPFI